MDRGVFFESGFASGILDRDRAVFFVFSTVFMLRSDWLGVRILQVFFVRVILNFALRFHLEA